MSAYIHKFLLKWNHRLIQKAYTIIEFIKNICLERLVNNVMEPLFSNMISYFVILHWFSSIIVL